MYDVIAKQTGLSREDVKPMFLAVIYGHPRDMHTKVGEAIRAAYPAVFDARRTTNSATAACPGSCRSWRARS